MKTKGKLYFAYGSNMNLNQMVFRCPDAQVVDTRPVGGIPPRFRMNGGGHGVATILPDGQLCRWRPLAYLERDEQSLDLHEGFPRLYGKEPVTVVDPDGQKGSHGLYHEQPLQGRPRTAPKSSGGHPQWLPTEWDRNRFLFWKRSGSTQRDTHHKVIPEKSPARKWRGTINCFLAPVGLRFSSPLFFILPKRRLL